MSDKNKITPVAASEVVPAGQEGGEPDSSTWRSVSGVRVGGVSYEIRGEVQRMPANDFTSEAHIIFLGKREDDTEFREYAFNVSEVESYE